MGIIGGLDVHRAQITYDYMDTVTGQVRRGRIRPACREDVRAWLQRFGGQVDVAFALEATTGWLHVVEELHGAGIRAHLAEPADTSVLRGPKRRAKTDAADAKLLRELLAAGRLPESWIPPAHIEQVRTLVRLRKALLDERGAWHQRLQAKLFHHGLPPVGALSSEDRWQWFEHVELPPASRQVVGTALRSIDCITGEMAPLDAQINWIVRRQPRCKALHRGSTAWGPSPRYASGPSSATSGGSGALAAPCATPGSTSRCTPPTPSAPRAICLARVRSCSGGPWYEAAMCAARPASPDHGYYLGVKAEQRSGRALLSQARRIARSAYHILLDLGEEALAPAPEPPLRQIQAA